MEDISYSVIFCFGNFCHLNFLRPSHIFVTFSLRSSESGAFTIINFKVFQYLGNVFEADVTIKTVSVSSKFMRNLQLS